MPIQLVDGHVLPPSTVWLARPAARSRFNPHELERQRDFLGESLHLPLPRVECSDAEDPATGNGLRRGVSLRSPKEHLQTSPSKPKKIHIPLNALVDLVWSAKVCWFTWTHPGHRRLDCAQNASLHRGRSHLYTPHAIMVTLCHHKCHKSHDGRAVCIRGPSRMAFSTPRQ